MSRLFLLWFLVAVVPAQAPAPSAGDVPVGKARLQVALGKVDAGKVELEVFTYRPEKWSGERLLFVLHGVLRNADEYRDHSVSMADRFDALVVAPKFDAERFPSRAYQRGGIQRADGSAAPPAEWTYARIPELAAAIRERTGKPKAQLFIIGHSAGGQFVMRMSAFQDTGAVRQLKRIVSDRNTKVTAMVTVAERLADQPRVAVQKRKTTAPPSAMRK